MGMGMGMVVATHINRIPAPAVNYLDFNERFLSVLP